MTRSAVRLWFQSNAAGALPVMAHPGRYCTRPMRYILMCFPLVLLAACAHVTQNTGDAGPAMYRPWKSTHT
jgi:hypothetical protein